MSGLDIRLSGTLNFYTPRAPLIQVADEPVGLYHYYVADLLTNEILAEIPFTGVSYQRAIKGAGSFEGSIAVLPGTDHLKLYENTLPGRTCVYVTRDGVCVWGGIIWSRSYDIVNKTLSVQGNEFTSYFYHRSIWKTWSNEHEATVTVAGGGTSITVNFLYPPLHYFLPGSSVKLTFREVEDWGSNGYYTVLDWPAPDTLIVEPFTTSQEEMFNPPQQIVVPPPATPADGSYALTTVLIRTDTYDYIRSLIDTVLTDFTGIYFPNDEIEPSVGVDTRILTVQTDGTAARFTTDDPHGLIVGQVVQVTNVAPAFDGQFLVSDFDTDWFEYESSYPGSGVQKFVLDFNSNVDEFASGGVSNSPVDWTTDVQYGSSAGAARITVSADDDAAYGAIIYAGWSVPGLWAITEGQEVTFRAQVQAESVARGFAFSLYFIDEFGGFTAGGSSVGSASYPGAWTEVSVTATADAGALWVVPVISFPTAPAGEIHYVGRIGPIPEYTPVTISTPVRTATVISKKIVNYTATLTTSAPHGFAPGETVVITNVDSGTDTSAQYNGTWVIDNVLSSTSFTYTSFSVLNKALTSCSGTATVTPFVTVGTYGPYSANSDILMDYSDNGFSGLVAAPTSYRGYEVRTVGAELDTYSDSIYGFEYRIDCTYNYYTATFDKTFVFIPINFPDPPPPGEISPVSRFGADKLVFEYPGNIMNAEIKESAENAATRFFVVGNIGDLGEGASQPYGVASATDYLEAGWPLLDAAESNNDVYDEAALYTQAQRYLAEGRPPVADITISVNGALVPEIGTYNPGDWCSLIINDEFVKIRLASILEPRDNVIVRKIDSIKVSVPDFPSYPETAELTLIPEWLVDTVGQ